MHSWKIDYKIGHREKSINTNSTWFEKSVIERRHKDNWINPSELHMHSWEINYKIVHREKSINTNWTWFEKLVIDRRQ